MFDTGSRPLINALLSAPKKSLKIFVATLASNTDSICSKPLLSNLLCILISKFLIYLIDFCRKKVFHHIFSAGGLHHCQRCQMAKDTQSRVDQRIKIRLVNLLQIALPITCQWLTDNESIKLFMLYNQILRLKIVL